MPVIKVIRTVVPGQPEQKARPFLKNNLKQKGQGVKCLPSKHKALSSSSSTAKNKK
jgi:hypothetical protein